MKKISTKNENMGKDFFSKETMISKFPEAHDTVHRGFTLVTGTNNYLKRDCIKSMLVDSCSKNTVVFIDTRVMLDNNDICLLSSHPIVDGKVRKYDVYADGLPVNLFSADSEKTDEEKAVDLFDVCSSIYRNPDSNHMELLQEGMSFYVEGPEDLTDCSASDILRIEKMQIFDILIAAESQTLNDPFLRELNYSIDSDLDDLEVQYNSWKDIIKPQGSLNYIYLNAGARDSAIPIANMLLASLRNYRKRNHETPIDLYINDISDLNFSCTGAIRKIINEADRLNINVIGIAADYHAPSTPEGEMMSSAGKQYFFFPTLSSKSYVNAALHITSSDSWPFKDMSGYGTFDGAVLKELVQDKYTGKSNSTVFKGDFRNYFSLDEFFL